MFLSTPQTYYTYSLYKMGRLYALIILSLLFGCSDKIADIPSKGVWVDINRMPHQGPYYLINGNLYLGEIYLAEDEDHTHILDSITENLPPLCTEGIDLNSFKFLLTHDDVFYAKDKDKVYNPLNVWAVDGYTCIERFAEELYVINEADPQTFKYLGDDYAVDKKNMYYRGWRIHWNDSILERFRVHK